MLASKFFAEDRNLAASGGNNTYTYSYAGVDYKIHKFTANGNFILNFSVPLDVVAVGGGGSASESTSGIGGSGGGGVINPEIVSSTPFDGLVKKPSIQ